METDPSLLLITFHSVRRRIVRHLLFNASWANDEASLALLMRCLVLNDCCVVRCKIDRATVSVLSYVSKESLCLDSLGH